jgi:hypothetical protein
MTKEPEGLCQSMWPPPSLDRRSALARRQSCLPDQLLKPAPVAGFNFSACFFIAQILHYQYVCGSNPVMFSVKAAKSRLVLILVDSRGLIGAVKK